MSFFLPKKLKQQRVDPDQAHASCARARAARPNFKNPPKITPKKLVKLTVHYWCLQRFDKIWKCSSRHDWKWKPFVFAETCAEKLVKPLLVNLFSVGFSLLAPLWGTQCEDHASGVGRDGGGGAGGEIVGRGILFRWDHGRVPLRQNFLKCNLIFGYRFFTYFPDIDQTWFWNYFRGHRSF